MVAFHYFFVRLDGLLEGDEGFFAMVSELHEREGGEKSLDLFGIDQRNVPCHISVLL